MAVQTPGGVRVAGGGWPRSSAVIELQNPLHFKLPETSVCAKIATRARSILLPDSFIKGDLVVTRPKSRARSTRSARATMQFPWVAGAPTLSHYARPTCPSDGQS